MRRGLKARATSVRRVARRRLRFRRACVSLRHEHEGSEPHLHLPQGLPERVQLILVRSLYGGGINEAPVDPLRRSREDRAFFGRGIAHGDHVLERLAGELCDVLGTLVAGIDVQPFEDTYRVRIDALWMRPRAVDIERIATNLLQQCGTISIFSRYPA